MVASPRRVQEVKNAIAAYELLETLKPSSQRDFLAVHAALMRGLADDAGRFRSGGVGVYQGNRFTFCPRLFHLMYVEGRWEDNHYTIEGKAIHRRVDRIDQILPETTEQEKPKDEEGDAPPEIARSVSLAADDLGLMGKLDLVSCDPEGGEAVPVETKRGRVLAIPLRAYPPERVQVMAQGLLLRRHGYRCDHGFIYFAGSRTRVRVDFDDDLEKQALETIAAVREGRGATVMPPPLEDSTKCWGCSLCGICLPDETRELRREHEAGESSDLGSDPRRLYPARDRVTPFYIQGQGARIGKTGERLTVTKEKEVIGEHFRAIKSAVSLKLVKHLISRGSPRTRLPSRIAVT